MNRFKNIFKRDEHAQGQSAQQQLPGRAATGGLGMNNGAVNGQADSDSQGDAEGFLCPTCMQSFSTPDGLHQHFAVAHTDPPTQVSVDKELELLKMQLTASEESRSLLSSELINMQKQMQQLAAEQPDTPDLSGEVKRLETQIELMQIENTELVEKSQLADKSSQELHSALTSAVQEQKTLNTTLIAEREKYSLLSDQLNQEKQRNVSAQEESRRLSEQLRKSEVAMEQLKLAASKADEMVAKVAGKEELCRNLEQQINDYKQNSIKHESEIGQLKRMMETKEENIKRSAAMHEEMKTAMGSKIHSMEALIQEKTTSLDRVLADNEQLQHKMQTLEGKLNDNQTELLEANKKYDGLHQNFVQKIDAGEGTNVIVTQLKEDNARVQEKLKHTEEKLQLEKEESYQKLKGAEAVQKELEQRLAELATEMEQLKVDLASAETRNASLQSDHSLQLSTLTSEHEATVADLQEAINSLKVAQQETTDRFEQDLSSQTQQNVQLTTSLQDNALELSSLRSQMEQLEENVCHLTNEKADLNKELSNQKEKVSEAAADNEHVNRQLTAKLTEVSQLNELTERLSKQQQEMSEDNAVQVESLTDRIKTLEDDLKSSEDLLQEKLSALDQLQEDSAVLNEAILEVKESLASAEAEKRRLEAENLNMQTLVTNLEMEKLSLNRETERLQGESTSTSTRLSSLSTELERSRELLQQKAENIQALTQQIDSQTKEGEILQSSLLEQIDQMQKEAKLQAEGKKGEVAKLTGDIEELKTKVKKQSETNAALSQEHAAALDKLDTAETQMASLQLTYEESKKELELVMQQMDKKAEDHSHILQETTEILQRTSDENEALTRALTELKTERSVVEEQLLNAQKNSDEWQSKHRLLQDDIEAVNHALLQEKTTSEETKQLLISNKLQMQSQIKTLEEEKEKVAKELEEAASARDVAEEKAQDNLRILEAALAAEKSKMEEAEAKYNMQLVSLTENLSLNKTDLTATQEKLMDVVKHNDELRGFNIELETKLEASNDERNMLWNRCMSSESETKALRDENEQLKTKIENLNSALYELGRENQSLQIKTTKAQARRWVEDEDVPDCTNCTKSFNVRVRRHHCRNCGNIFCHDCSSKQLQLPNSAKPSRVCDSCYTDLNR